MVNFEFRPFFRTKEERTEKRREQLRRAQKTFRERRDQYLRLLECQLSKFQSENAILISEAERLHLEAAALQHRLNICKQILRTCQIQTPENDWLGGDQTNQPDAFLSSPTPGFPVADNNQIQNQSSTNVRLDYLDGKPHQLVLTPSSLANSPQEAFTNFSTPNLIRCGTTKQRTWDVASPNHSPSRYLYEAQFVARLDTIVIAMEFVLKLESPCLPHIHEPSLGDDGDDHTPQGHMHTVSATLLSCISNTSKRESTPRLTALPSPQELPVATSSLQAATPQSFNAPRSILQTLLQRSEELPKESQEVTPIQAWHLIEQHAEFPRLNVAELENLTEKLLDHIKCYGFGGVIKQEFLQYLLQQL